MEILYQRTSDRVKDDFYTLYDKTEFKDIHLEVESDPELYNFVEYIKENGPRFGNYTEEKLEQYFGRIYELRKNNTDYTA